MDNRAVTLQHQSRAEIEIDDFVISTRALERPAPGQVLVKSLWISVDPYLVLRIRDGVFADGRMISRIIGRVVESRQPGIAEGDLVLGFAHWQEYAILDGAEARILHPIAPLSNYLGVVGHSGYTAALGLEIIDPQPGHTVTVSSAAGVVGSVAAQLAKLAGARVIGIAGAARARAVVDRLGLDIGLDHLAPDFEAQLALAAPDGIDRHFENVGSKTLDPVLGLINYRSRIALCGLIQHYDNDRPVCLDHFRRLLRRSVRMEAYHIEDHYDRYPEGLERLGRLVVEGKLHVMETISTGLDALPRAFVGMLQGQGLGKNLVHVGD